MKVSIVTVAFNSARTISDTLESVRMQSYKNIEHIVIDGSSTDGTLEIVRRHAGVSEKIISEPDAGIYDAMNKGVRMATGDVIGFLNSDDRFADRDVVKRIVQAMTDEKLDAVFDDVEFVHANNLHRVIRRYNSDGFHPDRIA